jgi:hypothetical protein
MTDVSREEVEVFTAAIGRLRVLVQRLRATNGPDCPLAKRLEDVIIPREEAYLQGWNSKK